MKSEMNIAIIDELLLFYRDRFFSKSEKMRLKIKYRIFCTNNLILICFCVILRTPGFLENPSKNLKRMPSTDFTIPSRDYSQSNLGNVFFITILENQEAGDRKVHENTWKSVNYCLLVYYVKFLTFVTETDNSKTRKVSRKLDYYSLAFTKEIIRA